MATGTMSTGTMAMGTTAVRPWRVAAGGMIVRVHLTPRSSRDGVDGIAEQPDGPVLKARVRANPVDGAANAALEALLAKLLGLRRSAISVTSGHTSRLKSVTVSGDPAAIVGQLETLHH
jgi:uncharacterized protein